MRVSKRFALAMAGLPCLGLLLSTAQAQPKSGATKAGNTRKAAASPAAPTSTIIPADAVEVEPGIFQHSDAKGKKWLYRRTPFGIAKYEPEPGAPAALEGEGITASEQGDSVRFERKTPFGVTRWTKKKTELNSEESAAWKRAPQPEAATAGPARGKE